MPSTKSDPPPSLTWPIVVTWLAYAGLWVFGITGTRALGPIVMPVFALGLVAALLTTIGVTGRALAYMLRSTSTPRLVLSTSVLSAMGVVGQLWLITWFFRDVFPSF